MPQSRLNRLAAAAGAVLSGVAVVILSLASLHIGKHIAGAEETRQESARLAALIADQHRQIGDLEASVKKLIANLPPHPVRRVTVTAYTPCREECDADPDRTAAMLAPRPGMVAVSRDLFAAGWTFGRKVYVEGVGVLQIADLMHRRYENRIDVLMFDRHQARRFGVKKDRIAALIQER